MRKKNASNVILIMDLCLMLVLLAFDQFTKYLAITHLKGQPAFVLIEGVFELQYLENRGSAFGILQGKKFLILAVGLVLMAFILFLLLKMVPRGKKFVPLHICLAAIVAGGVGNIIDRLRFDYVVDFFSFVLIHYPVFNVADCYIVVSTILLFVLFLFVYRDEDLEFLNFKKAKGGRKEMGDQTIE